MPIKLTALAIYKKPLGGASGKPRIIAGASEAAMQDDGSLVLTLDSVPLEGKKRAPAGGMLFLHGLYDHLEEMGRRHDQAAEAGATLSFVEYEFDMTLYTGPALKRGELPRGGFVYVRQFTAALQSQILARFIEYAREDGPRINEETSRLHQIAQRPDLWGRLCEDDASFGQLGGVVIPVADYASHPGGFRQLAYVRPGTEHRVVQMHSEGDRLVLPPWFASARSRRKPTNARPLGAAGAAIRA